GPARGAPCPMWIPFVNRRVAKACHLPGPPLPPYTGPCQPSRAWMDSGRGVVRTTTSPQHRRNRMKGIAASAVGVALLVGLAGCPRPTPITRYDVDPVSIEPSVHAQSLNDSGQVAGTDNTFSGALAALWSVDEGVKHL